MIWPAAIGYTGEAWGSSVGQVPVDACCAAPTGRSRRAGRRSACATCCWPRPPAPGGVVPADWVAERAWLLLKLGEADAARLLVASIDTDTFTPKMVQVAAQVALANSDPSGLCAIETALAKVEPQMAPLVTAMCASLAGESERAAADIEQARRRGRVDPIDIALADKVVGAGANTARAMTIEWEPVDAAELVALWPVDRDRDDAARAADRERRAAGARLAGARADVLGAAEDGGGADRGGDGGDVVRRDGRPLCRGL